MTNYDYILKTQPDLVKKALVDSGFLYYDKYGNLNKVDFKYLNKEIPEIPIDTPVDTPVYVWDVEDGVKHRAYLRGVVELPDGTYRYTCFTNGRTSWTSDVLGYGEWTHCKLRYEED